MVLLKKFLYLCTTLLVITVRMWPCANQVSLENIVICLILLFMIIIFYCKTRGKTNPKMQENAFQSSKSKNFRGSMCSHSRTPVTPLNFEHPPCILGTPPEQNLKIRPCSQGLQGYLITNFQAYDYRGGIFFIVY